MTTNLATASVDDLLAFLRSDSPPPKRAACPRLDKIRPRLDSQRKPPTPIELATLRRPPLAAERYRTATRAANRASGDYAEQRRHEDHANTLRRVECRAVAWLVCRALGPAWRFEPCGDEYHRGNHRFVHRATTATLSFRRAWNDDKRYEIVPENVHRTDSMPRSISVSGERSPASIASDIERRLIGAGLFEQNAALLSAGHERRAVEVQRRREVLAIARAYGGDLHPEHRWKHNTYPTATTGYFGAATDEYGHHRETEVSASSEYSGLEISVTTNNVQLAIKVAELVRRHYSQ